MTLKVSVFEGGDLEAKFATLEQALAYVGTRPYPEDYEIVD